MSKSREGRSALKIAALCGTALALQGCVAAAFPLVASGVMAGSARTSGTETTEIDQATTDTFAQQSSPEPLQTEPFEAEETPVEIAAVIEVPEEAAAIGQDAQAVSEFEANPTAPVVIESEKTAEFAGPNTDEATAVSATAVAVEVAEPSADLALSSSNAITQELVTVAPPQPQSVTSELATLAPAAPELADTVAAPVSAGASQTVSVATTNQVAGVTLFDQLYNYAASPDFLGGSERPSAMLSNATALQPDRVKCENGKPTVLVDLDPKEGELFPLDAGTASPALAERLTQLRSQGVSIAWISQSPTDRESLIRVALFRSGLDQLGADRILLVSGPDQRKQMLREHLAETSCLIAIAGDDRSDFHELFDYLLDPSDAVALEALIGDGWFLIPTPLLSQGSQ